MSDLIKRKDVAEFMFENRMCTSINNAYDQLQCIPTAYDIRKVVEELDCDRCESCSFLKVCAGSICCRECHKKTIEIVRHGGVSDDVCEWKQDKPFNGMYKACRNYVTYLKDFEYCPYCGKKIKVVK